MSRDINFLRHRRKRLTKAQAQDKKALRFSLIGFGVVVGIALITSGIHFFFIQRQNTLQREQDQLKAAILAQENAERTYVLLAGKLEAANQIFKLRQDKQAAIAFFYNQLGPNIILQQIEYDPQIVSDQQLRITVQAPEIFTFEQVKAVITSEAVKSQYPGITASNVNRESEGKYTIQLEIPLQAR